MSLFGWPGVMPEWPLDQSYETAYAKIVPARLNAEHATGPGADSKAGGAYAVGQRGCEVKREADVHFRRVRASLSQKLMVPSDPADM